MYTAKQYLFPESLAEAYGLLQKSVNNRIFAGGSWLRLGRSNIGTAIDITRLGLDTIEETDTEIVLGACVTLRQLETAPFARTLFGGAIKEALAPIGGVQLRNSATIGANIATCHGFSDPVTVLLALGTELEFYKKGRVSLEEHIKNPIRRDILTHIHIKKDGRRASYHTHRLSATDLAVLNVAASVTPEGEFRVSVGARPYAAALSPAAAKAMAEGGPEKAGIAAAEELCFDSNMRGSAEYRRQLCKVLVARALADLIKREVL